MYERKRNEVAYECLRILTQELYEGGSLSLRIQDTSQCFYGSDSTRQVKF